MAHVHTKLDNGRLFISESDDNKACLHKINSDKISFSSTLNYFKGIQPFSLIENWQIVIVFYVYCTMFL